MKKWFNVKNLMRFVFITFVASSVYIVIRIILAPTIAPVSDITVRVKSDYMLMLMQSIFGIIAMLLPGFLRRKVNLNIPTIMMIAYAGFLYCAIYLGEVRNFYYNVPHWDTILHTFSGVALGALGFSIVSLLNKSESVAFSLSPIFVAIFAFCFALALGTLWEMYEFIVDSILNTNMQKYALESGEPLIGQEALADTMKDLIVDAIGAFIISVIGYISLKHNKGWLDHVKVSEGSCQSTKSPPFI
ncbi:MAG: hypothetical protein FWG14_01095 [Peptococcaceae bacterium]|nr:hypothetical protein [Peptococcaceae bacterium]